MPSLKSLLLQKPGLQIRLENTHITDITEKLWVRLWFGGNSPAIWKQIQNFHGFCWDLGLGILWGLVTEYKYMYSKPFQAAMYLDVKQSYKANAKRTNKPPISQPGRFLLPSIQHFHFCQSAPLPTRPLQLSKASPPTVLLSTQSMD